MNHLNYPLTIFLFFTYLSIKAQVSFGPVNVITDFTMSYIEHSDLDRADLDGDGDIDFALVSYKSNLSSSPNPRIIAWYENDGNEGFTKVHIVTEISSNAGFLYLEDMDGDGHMDIVVTFGYDSSANRQSDITWYRNDGNGNFQEAQTLSIDTIEDVQLADIDSDGDIDLMLPNEHEIIWVENDGNGNLGTQHSLWYGFQDLEDAYIVDQNGDGDMDIISIFETSSTISISLHENDGNENFSAPQTLINFPSSSSRSLSSKPTDYNNDGYLDLLVYKPYSPVTLVLFLNNGNNTFTQTFNEPDVGRGIPFDWDNDGNIDILTIENGFMNTVYWHKNLGTGNFNAKQPLINDYDDRISSDIQKFERDIVDLDNDGDWDFLLHSDEQGWHENNGNGNFMMHKIANLGSDGTDNVQSADLDGDGDLDIVSSSNTGYTSNNNKIAWYENDGYQNFGEQQLIFAGEDYDTYLPAIGDINGDEHLDIVLRNSTGVSWIQNNGTGQFNAPININSNSDLHSFSLVDLDGDLDLDLISHNTTDIVYNINNGLGNFGPSQVLGSNLDYVGSCLPFDMDNDGDMDIISAITDERYVIQYENDGTGNFSAAQVIAFSNDKIYYAYAGDMDNDGDLDLFTSQYFNKRLVRYENNGSGNYFGPETQITNGNFDYAQLVKITTGDMDNDGNMDLITVDLTEDRFQWHRNLGNGNFATTQQSIHQMEDGNAPRTLCINDMDNDGDLDLLGAGKVNGGKIIYLENKLYNNLFVDASATGNNDGKTWQDAFTDLQDALALGINKTIAIAEGTYLPTSSGLRGVSFEIPEGTALLGGYPMGGGQRNTDLYETILSGNVDNNSSISGNSYHVVTAKDADNIILDGITIRDGNADDANSVARARGGGLYIKNSTITLNNCEIKWNKAIYGGGIFSRLSDNTTISNSTLKKNRAEFGSAIYHSSQTNLYITHSRITDNTSLNRAAIEVYNSLYTNIQNSLIANNPSANANAISFIATNRDQSCEINNSTILGESTNKRLITVQVGFGDRMDLDINNSIIAHQNIAFNKNIKAYNNGVFDFRHNNCYFQGGLVSGAGTNTLLSAIDGELMLNADYTVDPCSPVVNAGNNSYAVGTTDLLGNPRISGTVDIGAFESQGVCFLPRKAGDDVSKTFRISPNPVSSDFEVILEQFSEYHTIAIYDMLARKIFQHQVESNLSINTSQWDNGIYTVVLYNRNGNILGHQKLVKTSN